MLRLPKRRSPQRVERPPNPPVRRRAATDEAISELMHSVESELGRSLEADGVPPARVTAADAGLDEPDTVPVAVSETRLCGRRPEPQPRARASLVLPTPAGMSIPIRDPARRAKKAHAGELGAAARKRSTIEVKEPPSAGWVFALVALGAIAALVAMRFTFARGTEHPSRDSSDSTNAAAAIETLPATNPVTTPAVAAPVPEPARVVVPTTPAHVAVMAPATRTTLAAAPRHEVRVATPAIATMAANAALVTHAAAATNSTVPKRTPPTPSLTPLEALLEAQLKAAER